jgi:hypothetical protein
VPALCASVAADRDQQYRRAPPERLVGQPPDHAVARRAIAAAAPAPPLIAVGGLNDPARQDRPVGLEALPGDFEPELVQTAERRQIGTAEACIGSNTGRVRHVEVFILVSDTVVILGGWTQVSAPGLLCTLPVAVFEFSVGVYLTVKGFRPAALAALDRHSVPTRDAAPVT